ncbi:potassium transporter [Geobacter metallireducens RCH3]|uniref:Probable potassium transport system protein Kup 1 n=1 Tax=Geobacter metallireducens (strain ATCC 53774 / DSM 7210 / GS-15) TaxID=269799 RepID=KUP1_GEOMG|nr:KUP/HAK/KT family potassium transporter [Geobacter metallireducens]Q39ZN6.1 RecName: Full=Probable potassium transport system protein Kup 1 [Geobacter metallireducens GS-15]ABB30288.1 Kup system potassium transporter [Geobacter metallireducens GS-15]EHP85605.1 potassium transporter [Geobacter metallireducens RCH3]
MDQHKGDASLGGIVKALGLVFGDIGTSPIYTLTVIFTLTQPTRENVFGILSLVFWTMTILVTMEYAWLAMSLGRKGQGGEIVLREIIMKLVKTGRLVAFAGFLSFVGVSLLLGDGVITPAISILSAVEGLLLIPGLEGLSTGTLVAIAAAIAIGLFSVQFKGTDRVAGAFGPIMAVWFSTLAVTGVVSALSMPEIVEAINPWHAFTFFRENGLAGYFVLSEVILCSTGGEALYADMGHLGRRPIVKSWYFVFMALYLNYLGQGVFAITHPEAKNLLFGMVRDQMPTLYIPFLILTIMATIIASQSIISGVFSIVYQGITTRLLPLMRVDYTSREIKSQIYLGAVNWSLMVAVILVMLLFRKSENLAAAYGMAVTGSMTITGIMMIIVFAHTTKKWRALVALVITLIDAAYLLSTFSKIPHGAYWSLILASIPFVTIIIWTRGQRSLYHALKPLDLETFLISYEQIYAKGPIRGTGLFFTRDTDVVPPYVVHCIIRSNIIYERNVFISLVITDEPLGVETELIKGIGPGLDAFRIEAGYMEVVDIEALLKANGIQEKVIFYGVEDISTRNPLWRVFSVFKKLTPNFVQFHKLPASRLQGVVTRVEM